MAFTDCVYFYFSQLTLEFESRSPEIADFQQLLQQLFLKAPVNLTDMTSLLIHQPKMGSVIIKVYSLIIHEDATPAFIVSQKYNRANLYSVIPILCNNL